MIVKLEKPLKKGGITVEEAIKMNRMSINCQLGLFTTGNSIHANVIDVFLSISTNKDFHWFTEFHSLSNESVYILIWNSQQFCQTYWAEVFLKS